MKKTSLMLAWLLVAPPVFSQSLISSGLQWRWGSGSAPRTHIRASRPQGSALFESDKKWGAKEWLIIGGGILLAVGIGIAISSSNKGGSGSSSGGY